MLLVFRRCRKTRKATISFVMPGCLSFWLTGWLSVRLFVRMEQLGSERTEVNEIYISVSETKFTFSKSDYRKYLFAGVNAAKCW
jgi:hypothetical protein